jgi:beta-lactamase superfamily II metal-dependent hydrolase
MANEIGYEIDFLAVGDGERSGDAIAVRYGSPGAYRVMVVDGGNKASGEELVEHVKTCYNTKHVDYLVNTHPDTDHASGLEVVLNNLSVGEVWVHQPWNYPSQIVNWLKDGRITTNSLRDRLQDAMQHAHAVYKLAKEKRIPVKEPFQASQIGEFWVASPSREWYLEIIPHFDKTPETKAPPPTMGLLGRATALAEKALAWLDENWNFETLRDDGATSYDNESSVVLYGNFNGRGVLLTGDAGVQALTHAADYLEKYGISLPDTLRFVQVPHHGSRHNVGPTILNRILGPRQPFGSVPTKTAYVSAGTTSQTHPRRVVTNAFKRRGVAVFAAKGQAKCHYYGVPARPTWGNAIELPLYDTVEA